MTSDELDSQAQAEGFWGLAHGSLSKSGSQLSGHYDKIMKAL